MREREYIQFGYMASSMCIVSTITLDSWVNSLVPYISFIYGRSAAWLPTYVP